MSEQAEIRREFREVYEGLARFTVDEIARMRGVVDALPTTADGVPLVPGMSVFKRYGGELWVARVESVAASHFSGSYRNDASHRALYSTFHYANPREWFASADAATAAGPDEGGNDDGR